MGYTSILRNYVQEYAIPIMLELGWTFQPAKSYGWAHAKRGAEFHVDQSLRTHIINGCYSLTHVLEYLDSQGYVTIKEMDFKRTLVLYTFHDAYKDRFIAAMRMGNSDFSIPLATLEDLIERTGIRNFIPISAEDVRLASVSLLSDKIGDLPNASPEISRILPLVHLADAFASQQSGRDCGTAENRIRELTDATAFFQRQKANPRLQQRLNTAQMSKVESRPPLALYYHELDDYRGLSTLLIHQATEDMLREHGLCPILYFANGILYIGPQDLTIEKETLHGKIAKAFFTRLRNESGSTDAIKVARDAWGMSQGVLRLSRYAYLFCSFEHLLQAVAEMPLPKKVSGFVNKQLATRVANKQAKRIAKERYLSVDEFFTEHAILPDADINELEARHWLAAHRMIMAVESIASAFVDDTLQWLCSVFCTPPEVADRVKHNFQRLRDGGVADHCLIIAYHWLIQTRFMNEQRTWQEVETETIRATLIDVALKALKLYEKADRLLEIVEKELGFGSDMESYLNVSLQFSFHRERLLQDHALAEYERERDTTYKRLCTICNRFITTRVTKQNSQITASIAEQAVLVFSNKVHPIDKIKNTMVWCPMCYLEAMMRKLSGQSYPDQADYNESYRLHLYVLPDYSFTPQLWDDMGAQLLENFHPHETTVSNLHLRGTHDYPGIAQHWLQTRTVDQSWLDAIRSMFAKQAAYLKTPGNNGKKPGPYRDRITFSFKNPNYILITYSNTVPKGMDQLRPTQVEVWSKALYAATLIMLLTGARVYITDKPYLTITRPEEMKTIIEMEGLHPLLAPLFPFQRSNDATASTTAHPGESGARLPLATIPVVLDLLSAIWEATTALFPTRIGEAGKARNMDKQVAAVLEEMRANNLAGATLYTMHERKAAHPPTATFTRACQILLPYAGDGADPIRNGLSQEGYELMFDKEGSTWMDLAQQITDLSLKLYLPLIGSKLGRAHRYETILRTGIEAIKSNIRTTDDQELTAKVGGSVLKRLERLIGGFPTYGEERTRIVQELAEVLVCDLYRARCKGSISNLTHEENSLADAIFFLTTQQIGQRWAEYKAQKKQRERAQNSKETFTVEIATATE